MAQPKMNMPRTAQHFLECGIQECERNCEFYCNSCHHKLCKQCRDEHLKSPENKKHEVVLYQQRKGKLVEKCKIHPTKDVDMFCEECQVPLCSKCATKIHQKHTFIDLEVTYAEKIVRCQEEMSRIHDYFLPTSHALHKKNTEEFLQIKTMMDNIRTSMKTEGESLKSLVDTVVSESIKQLDQMEKSLLEDLKTQDKTLDDYITYLNNLVKELHRCLYSTEPQKIIYAKKTIIRSIPETTKPVTPEFTAGQYSKSDVAELLDRIWISDNDGNFVQTDLQGNELQKIIIRGGYDGYHTVTQDGILIFADRTKKVIIRVTQNGNCTEFIETGNWEPFSIHSSHINGDLLVGMWKDKQAKVTRYNKTGKQLQNVQKGNEERGLYSVPHYITENTNGDICTADYNEGIVVVNKSGQHRFSYTGQKLKFRPFGICTDVLGHILVCDSNSETVHLLDQDGQFLHLLLTRQQGVDRPRSLCVDNKNNLYIGQRDSKTLTVYKYLQ
ncbi:tripartite motif-containing protein 2-like [Saccostrea echinata]|uniref:tripartite motif-containing protein 2-like n=1 Tax=Saccostrea echinata TaxID=191078 RepID=UPI002A804B9F|nr:tripartite motif-containing protein 2-like [Saccostrea echinata]